MFRTLIALVLPVIFATGCAGHHHHHKKKSGKVRTVRTTAYAACEGSNRNAIGGRLSSGPVKSAAADWSRFPLGTKFKVVKSGEVYQIDDYGSALIGTDTIDLFKPSRASMNAWGVRHVDIQILEWGSEEKSLQVLKPRSRVRIVRAMVESLNSEG